MGITEADLLTAIIINKEEFFFCFLYKGPFLSSLSKSCILGTQFIFWASRQRILKAICWYKAMVFQTFWSNPATNHFSLSDEEMGLQWSPGKLIALTQLHVYPVSRLWAPTRNYRYFLFGEIFLSQQVRKFERKNFRQNASLKDISPLFCFVFFQKKTVLTVILQYIFCKYLYLLQYVQLCMKVCAHTQSLGDMSGKAWPAHLHQGWIFCHWLCPPAQLLDNCCLSESSCTIGGVIFQNTFFNPNHTLSRLLLSLPLLLQSYATE